MKTRISPAAIQSLKEALARIYWYKKDLRGFVSQCVSSPEIVGRLNWSDYKHNIAATLVDHLVRSEEEFRDEIFSLMFAVCDIRDFSHLRRLDGGDEKARNAKDAVDSLRLNLQSYRDPAIERTEREGRRTRATNRLAQVNAVKMSLANVKADFVELVISTDAQGRGYALEKIMTNLFGLFDLDPKASFRVVGEQIDGAFSFDSTDYLFEAKWQKEPVGLSELDGVVGKLSRKLDNTLGLFLSINGFSEGAVVGSSSGRRMIFLMDGEDLMAVLENRIDMVQLLRRKRQHAARTGTIFIRVRDIVGGAGLEGVE